MDLNRIPEDLEWTDPSGSHATFPIGRIIRWLRWGLEEVGRGTEPRAGNGDAFAFRVVCEALESAGIPTTAAGIQKPTKRVD
jgi:hypothetical protein